MIAAIKALFQERIADRPQAAPAETRLRLATAALLIEMARADFQRNGDEMAHLEQRLQQHFGLSPADTATLTRLAEAEVREAVSLHQFTRLINDHLDISEKEAVLTLVWEIAYADGHLDQQEEHLARKVADLLHLRHSEYIRAKHRARSRLGLDTNQTDA